MFGVAPPLLNRGEVAVTELTFVDDKVRVFPDGVIVIPGPAANVTAPVRPLRLNTLRVLGNSTQILVDN